MKKRPDDSRLTSRRRFTKAVAAALAAAPLASCAQQGGQGQNSNQANANQPAANQNTASQAASPSPTEPRMTICFEGSDLGLRSDHEPPTIFGDSMHLELDQRLKNISDNTDSNRPPKRQVADIDSAYQYLDIRRVYVYTEFKHFPRLVRYDFSPGYNPQLRLWLRDAKANPDEGYEPIRPEHRPEVIVSGNFDIPDPADPTTTIKTLLFESNKHFTHIKKTPKMHRRNRHEHKHNNRDFRIAKWDLVKPDGSSTGFGDDSNVPVTGAGHAQRYSFMIVCRE
jgi:hypothetical protein